MATIAARAIRTRTRTLSVRTPLLLDTTRGTRHVGLGPRKEAVMTDATRSALDKRSDFVDEKVLDGKDSGDPAAPEILVRSDEDDDEEGDAEEPEGEDLEPR